MRPRFALAAFAAGVVALVATASAPAGAHIHADPAKVVQGEPADVGFGIEHGCDSSPTTSVEIVVPRQVRKATAIGPSAWTATPTSARGKQSIVVGGPAIASGTEFEVRVQFIAPAKRQTLVWKLVQTCTVGVHRWLEVERKGEPEPESPAPVVKVVAKRAATNDDSTHRDN